MRFDAACICFFDVGVHAWPDQCQAFMPGQTSVRRSCLARPVSGVHAYPDQCHACSRTALFDAEMHIVYSHQHFLAHCFRYDNAVDHDNLSIIVHRFYPVVPMVQDGFRAFLALTGPSCLYDVLQNLHALFIT